MSVQLRLQRHGTRNSPFYHVVAADHRKPRDSRFIEKIGFYDPKSEPSKIVIDAARLQFWYSKGAGLSNTVAVLAKRQGIALSREKTKTASKKK